MGKVRQPVRHSNHHDNPHRNRKAVVRRQHSQDAAKSFTTRKIDSLKQAKSIPKDKKVYHPVKLKVPFSKWDQVLLVGEGDFTFALSLARNYDVESIVATCFDTKDVLEQKYPFVQQTIQKLSQTAEIPSPGTTKMVPKSAATAVDETKWNGFSPSGSENNSSEDANSSGSERQVNVNILYGIDATRLSSAHKKILRTRSPFTRIVFNFPHVGGLSTDVNRQVRSNQQLLVDFFNSAKPLLATKQNPARSSENGDEEYDSDNASQQKECLQNGQILVTLFEGEPYTLWNIRDLARHSGLRVVESFKFPWSAYPGYRHARTIGDITTGKDRSEEGKRKGAWRGEERDARCYLLAIKGEDDDAIGSTSRKRKKEDEDSD